MSEPLARDQELLLNAYIDGELSPAEVLAIEQKLATDPVLANAFVRLKSLRDRVAKHLPRMTPPPGLAARVDRAVGARRMPRSDWMRLAASVIVAAGIGSSATFLALRNEAPEPVPTAVTANHIRALMAPQPIDVVSSDRHTVKPWFSGRIPQAPVVVDLSAQGFPLVGGRIDVIGTAPAPTLVFRHRQHLISLTAVPTARPGSTSPAPRQLDGYHLLTWSGDGVIYWAVSDVEPTDLEAFARAFRGAAREG